MNPQSIVSALRAPEQNVVLNWPLIVAALSSLGINSDNVQVAAAATIAVECPSWKPQTEKYNGDPLEYFKKYDGRTDLGNIFPGDGYKFRGRGFIQITGRANYSAYGHATGQDLVNQPDNALIPSVSAKILAGFFKARSVNAAADAGDWVRVRRLVNGGTNGLDAFQKAVDGLIKIFSKMA